MRAIGALPGLLLVTACAGAPVPRAGGAAPAGDGAVKIGAAYEVRGVRYVPADDPYYDALGLASWYGAESGGQTANGERNTGRGFTAAHPTLPLPSYVEVTALATGRTIVVRVNDRGPFARGRLIDLSPPAAKALGIDGAAPVRVRRVYPADEERAALRRGEAGDARLTASAQLLAALRARLAAGDGGIVKLAAGPMPKPPGDALPVRAAQVIEAPVITTPVPRPDRSIDDMPVRATPLPASVPAVGERVPGAAPLPAPAAPPPSRPRPAVAQKPSPPVAGNYAIQLGAFGDKARAAALAREVGGRVVPAGALHRVRVGAYSSEAAAREALAKLAARGYAGAAIVRE